MSTRATYQIFLDDAESITYYIHTDGYPEFAATYFYNMVLVSADTVEEIEDGPFKGKKTLRSPRGSNAEFFLRGNNLAVFTESHDAHGDTEFQYTLNQNGDFVAVSRAWNESPVTIFSGKIWDFINSYKKDAANFGKDHQTVTFKFYQDHENAPAFLYTSGQCLELARYYLDGSKEFPEGNPNKEGYLKSGQEFLGLFKAAEDEHSELLLKIEKQESESDDDPDDTPPPKGKKIELGMSDDSAPAENLQDFKKPESREELRALSQALSAANMSATTKTNDLLINLYSEISGCSDFRTFKQWKEEGYQVAKGSKAWRIWGKPVRAKKQANGAEESEENGAEFFPVCCLFDESQLEKTEGKPHQTKKPTLSIVANDKPKKKEPAVSNKNNKLAEKLQTLADGMQAKIGHCLGHRETNTPRKLAQAVHMRIEGQRLQRAQAGLAALAKLHNLGEVPPILADVKTKARAYELASSKLEPVPNGWHAYYTDTQTPNNPQDPAMVAFWALISDGNEEKAKAEKLRAKINGLQFSSIPGYFPTPPAVVDKMLGFLRLQEGDKVLEPSAGSGHILDKLAEINLDLSVTAYEKNGTLREILTEKGYALAGNDFLQSRPFQKFDAIAMNPPFENMQDIDHINHALQLLKPGGELVAICSPSRFNESSSRTKIKQFIETMHSLNAYIEELPTGSFKESGTDINTALIYIKTPAAQ